MARKIIQGNVLEILNKIIKISNGQRKDISNESDDYSDNSRKFNFRRSSKTNNFETEESDDEIIQEANRYVIEQLGKHIKERVIEDLVSKYLRNKLNFAQTESTQRIKNTAKTPQFKKPNTKHKNDDNIKKSTEISRENEQMQKKRWNDIKKSTETSRENKQSQNKRWTRKHYAKNFNNNPNELLRKIPETKPTPNIIEKRKPRYTIKNSVRNKQVKGNEIFVILQPKVDSLEEKDIIEGRVKNKQTTTRKFRFIKKTRKEYITPSRYTKAKVSQKKLTTIDLIYERIKLNTNSSNEYSEKDEKIQETPINNKKIKSNLDNIKSKNKVSKETDIVRAVTSYLWVDGDDDIEENDGNIKEISTSTVKSKKPRFQTTPFNYEESPTIVDKYDFGEPLPEKDRVRENIKTIKKPPSRINKKQKAI